MRRIGTGLVLVLALSGCVGSIGEDVGATLASVASIRGRATVDGAAVTRFARAGRDDALRVESGGLARVTLDDGGDLLVDGGARLVPTGDASLKLEAGRVYARARGRSPLVVETPQGTLRLSAAEASLELAGAATVVHVIRGEVAYVARGARGVARAGEELRLEGGRATERAEQLWADWTGGLAEPGPRASRAAEGVGVLEGRVPDAIGEARWPLVIRDMRVTVRVVGDLAITEVEQVFFNPASETVEGIYRIAVPDEAVLHRFAVDRNGRMVDGYVREKQQAARAYEAQVYRGSTLDPALLEWDAPGRYRARIYPIQAGESRRIAIRYSEWLSRTTPEGPRVYRYRMAGSDDLPPIQELALVAELGGSNATAVRAGHGARVDGDRVVLRRSDFQPRAYFVLELEGEGTSTYAYRADHSPPPRDPRAGPAPAEEESDYFFLPLRISPPTPPPSARGLDLVVVADLSAGTDRSHLELGRTVIEALSTTLRPEDRIAIVAGDLAIRTVQGASDARLGPASRERVTRLLDGLSRMPSGGATDLGAMLVEAAGLLDPARPGAVVYVGDGSPTVGELGAGTLLERLARLPAPLRAYALAVGADANLELLSSLVRGGGLAERVETRAEAAEAALRLFAHASRPVVSRVEVDLGAGIDRLYPRGSRDVVLGDVLPIVGRVRGSVPSSVKVRGLFAGRPFEQRVTIETKSLEDEGDLRLRWASARLEQLLLSGAQRVEVADLGTRFGIITPFTSFYVPSAAELTELGPRARPLYERGALAVAPRVSMPWSLPAVIEWPLAGLLGLAGCSNESAAPERPTEQAQASSAPPSTVAPTSTTTPGAPAAAAPPAEAEEARSEAQAAADRAANVAAVNQPQAAAPMPEPAPASPVAATGSADGTTADAPAQGFGGLGLRGTGVGGGGTGEDSIGMGSIGTIGHGAGSASGSGYGRGAGVAPMRSTRSREARRAVDDLDANPYADERERAAPPPTSGTSAAIVATTVLVVGHDTRRCSDAAPLLLDARKGLWRERLANAYSAYDQAQVFERATRACETPTWRDRRVLLDLVLTRAGDVPGMIGVYRELSQAGARLYLRRAILARVRTPDDLRAARDAFGSGAADAALIEGELARATDEASKLRILRALAARFSFDLDLALRLLAALEHAGHKDEAMRVAEQLRGNPLADAGVRTAIGEMYLRFGDEAEARRVFSEIVEFAPNDELARRRLGDLYRAHGWYDDAYRQYQTLATIRPDDPTVNLLLAQAAAGAGRIDEALRLEQRLAETASPGGAEGAARTAMLWSSVRLAELRKTAREANDAERVRAYLAALRRGGMLRQASALRATLVWAHPDADLALYASHPGLSLTRPEDLAPEFGLEAFDVAEQEPGTYRFEVRRGTHDSLGSVDAKLVVVLREGARDERIAVFPLRFDATHRSFAFAVEGDAIRTATPTQPEAGR